MPYTEHMSESNQHKPDQQAQTEMIPKKGKKSYLGIVLIVCAVILCAVVAAGVWLIISSSSSAQNEPTDTQTSQQSSLEASKDRSAPAHPNKLAGSTETTDANGIVHGITPDGITYVVYGRGAFGRQTSKVTLSALGDVLVTDNNINIIDGYDGSRGDGAYDLRPFFQGTADQAREYDLRFINQETIADGSSGFSGYPVFNSPDTITHSIAAEGFNIVNLNSNHTWDMGAAGIEHTHALWDEYPEVMLIGSYDSPEDAEAIHMIERNGTTFAFLSYCYGDNFYGTDPNEFPNSYYSTPFDDGRMADDIARARKVADAVIVYMHWGSEYTWQPNDQQVEYAEWLADQGVDLIIGSHAHILQPIKYVTSESGNTVLTIYGLSDFISGWTLTDTILSGMFTCDFVWQKDGTLSLENPMFYPAIEWSDGRDVYVRFLKDMSDAEIADNTRTEDVGDDVGYLHRFLDDLEMDIPVVWD
ncbi:MAG: CapA family protein [Eggerthellaceae bacterium]|nr:CapA family protein [Eggerthellaceae bacterium]